MPQRPCSAGDAFVSLQLWAAALARQPEVCVRQQTRVAGALMRPSGGGAGAAAGGMRVTVDARGSRRAMLGHADTLIGMC